ncbi:MAG: ABC transporter ATP-binding protein [Gammaproteobacteria bacterium WSBS_2016_MAG_OTU1]
MISARDITMVFHAGDVLETTALRGINLDIAAGEFVTVIGSNGAGKSTLLNILAGDITPTSGDIFIENEKTTSQAAHERARQVARVFQDPLAGTCAYLTIEENMSLALSRGTRRSLRYAVSADRRQFFAQRLQLLGLNLENRLSETAGQLSGGQRQALSLVMAALSDSRILLLDEHTAALDPRMAEFVLELTRRLSEEYSPAILMVTHSMKSALSCGTRTIMLHQGKVALDVGGEERNGMQVQDLLNLFAKNCGQEVDGDRMLLA